nr:uncharacterized protein LOC105344498 isoform X7 [Crassostrea gigas]
MQEEMSLSKYKSNRGTTHFARIARAILGPCMDVLREVLAKEISPPDLEKKVKDYISQNRKPPISEKQKQLVYSKKYSDFDITLLYFLFRNICSISQHENKWGKDPKPTDKGVSANIERVRILRNEWYGHATDFSLSDSDFKQRWNHISQIVKDLEGNLGTSTKYQDILILLKTCFMDPESIEIYIDTLLTDITNLKEGFGELQTDVTDIKEGVGELQTDVTNIKEGFGELQTDVTNMKKGFGELQTDVTNIKESFGEFQTDVTSLKEGFEELQTDVSNMKEGFGELQTGVTNIKESFGEFQTDVTSLKGGFGELQTDVTNMKEGFGELQTDVTNIKESFGEFQTDVTSLKEDVEEIKKTNEKYSTQESQMEKSIFDQWEQDESCFVSTNACEEVEKIIKSRNLVIVGGHSGSGKSAIIQHIALKYRKQGWTVRRVTEVKEIVNEYSSSRFQKNKTICVFNDPLGKESFDEILNNSWQRYEEEITTYLKTAKLFMSCRNYITSESRITRYLVQHSDIVDINNDQHKLSKQEKIQILNIYMSSLNLSKEECNRIVKTERYFPLLCKLYSEKKEYLGNIFKFFEEPVTVLEGEISYFKNKNKEKYLALVLLVLFNNKICIGNLLENKEYSEEFKHGLNLCGFNSMAPFEVGNNLDSLNEYLVKKVDDTYHFYHDFVMEVTTHVFGTDYPTETIKYADIGFLRRRVKLGNFDKHDDSFTIYLSDRYIEKLGERLYTELFGERVVDVVLNPCLRNENVIEVLQKKIAGHPENHYMLLETKKLTIDKQKLDLTSKTVLMNKLEFLELENEVSPLFVLIVFCHTQLSLYCLNFLEQKHTDNSSYSAVCCNGSTELFNYVCKDHAEKSFNKTWGNLCHIHIVSLFHNYDLLYKLIKEGVHVNKKTDNYGGWTPLMLAAGNDIRENDDYNHRETGAERRDKTVQLLLSNGADINLCNKNGATPLYIACQNGHNSTVQLLLSNGADLNLCDEDGTSPLFVACQNGHNSTVKLLLSNGADINLCREDGVSPLSIACFNGHDSTVPLLLSNGADINLCLKDGTSPLYIACQNGHNSTVQLLLSNGADIILCIEDGTSPLSVACFNGHDSTVQLLLSNGADINLRNKNGATPLSLACFNGHNSTVQLLLSNGADINLCLKDGTSPLYIACQNGHNSTVQLLLSNGADINLCREDGTSPLSIACFKGHNSTVQLLLRKGADINLCLKDGTSPLYIACQNGHNSTVKLLLSNGADINLCREDGTSPLSIACLNGHNSTVPLLLSNGADINLCDEDGVSPLYIVCENGHNSTVQLLLSNGADINLCIEDGTSPLSVACSNGHDSTVQLLLSNGADINLCREDGTSPLYIACQNGHNSTVQLLLSNGADINLCIEDGTSPLSVGCQNGHNSTVQLLLSNGADINLRNKNGATSLYIACQNGHNSTVHLLLSKGADINLCTKDRVSPLIYAFVNRHYETVNILLNNGADSSLACGWEVNPALVDCFDKQDCTVVFLLQKGNILNNLYDPDSYFSLFVSCQVERVTRTQYFKNESK